MDARELDEVANPFRPSFRCSRESRSADNLATSWYPTLLSSTSEMSSYGLRAYDASQQVPVTVFSSDGAESSPSPAVSPLSNLESVRSARQRSPDDDSEQYSHQSWQVIAGSIVSGEAEGAALRLGERGLKPARCPNGNWVISPSIQDHYSACRPCIRLGRVITNINHHKSATSSRFWSSAYLHERRHHRRGNQDHEQQHLRRWSGHICRVRRQ